MQKTKLLPTKTNSSIFHFTILEQFIVSGIVFLYSASPALAQTVAWSGVCVGGSGTDLAADVATISGIECLIANVFTVIITLIGLSAFVMLVVGSLRWLASGGNSSALDKAKGTMTYAVVGIVVSLSAFIVLNLIAGFTGVEDITRFSIPSSSTIWP